MRNENIRNENGQFIKGFGLGKKKSKFHIENIRKAKMGNKNPMFGKHHSQKTIDKISTALKGNRSGNKNPMYGKSSWNKGLTKDTNGKVKRIAESKTGVKRPEISGKNHPNFGKEMSKEIKDKISKANRGRKVSKETRRRMSESKKGEKSYLYKGGITSKNIEIRNGIEYRLWREAVFARDNWTCQKTNVKIGGDLNSHHIQNFSDFKELRFAIDNGITLSKKSHQEFHKIYGRKNNTREQLEEFLKN